MRRQIWEKLRRCAEAAETALRPREEKSPLLRGFVAALSQPAGRRETDPPFRGPVQRSSAIRIYPHESTGSSTPPRWIAQGASTTPTDYADPPIRYCMRPTRRTPEKSDHRPKSLYLRTYKKKHLRRLSGRTRTSQFLLQYRYPCRLAAGIGGRWACDAVTGR
jgi:hypothetical protein